MNQKTNIDISMGQFFKVLGNLVFGVLFAMMFFLWTFANAQTFDPKEIIQYVSRFRNNNIIT